MRRFGLVAVVALALAMAGVTSLAGCAPGRAGRTARPTGDSPTATQEPSAVSLYSKLDASGANEQEAMAALPQVLDAYRKDEPGQTQVDISGIEPQLVAYEVQAEMKQADGGGLTIWQWPVLSDRVSDDARLEPVTMTDMQSGLPGATPASAGEKNAVEWAISAITEATPSAAPANASITKYWFFYDAGDKGNLLIAVGADGYYRGSSFGGL